MYCQTNFTSALKTLNGEWAFADAERANTFANHLSAVFKPFSRQVTTDEEQIALCNSVVAPCVAIQHITKKDTFLLYKV